MKKILSLIISILLVLSLVAFCGCSEDSVDTGNNDSSQSDDEKDYVNNNDKTEESEITIDTDENVIFDSNKDKDSNTSDDADSNADTNDTLFPVATIVVKDYGTIKVELYPEKAPITVSNFISLADNKFYDGLTFHRVIENFIIQGGCPEGTGIGGPGYSIKGEFSYNGFDGNDIAHERGVISMARGSYSMDSAGSQFFIMHKTSPHLDGQYAAFGRVIEGMDVVDAVAAVQTDLADKPIKSVVIESVSVETFGLDIPDLEIIR